MILHDWPTTQCVEILSQLKSGLKPGHSRIVLNEIVIPEQNAGWFETSVDVLMMHVHSAQERREREWRELVGKVDGLKVPLSLDCVLRVRLILLQNQKQILIFG